MRSPASLLLVGLLLAGMASAENLAKNAAGAANAPAEVVTRDYPSGGKYRGELRGGQRDGQGTYWYANGDIYEGAWKDGQKHGWGVYRWPDGNRYEGEWVNGERHGMGVFVFADGGVFDGEWRFNKPLDPGFGRTPPPRRMGSE
jgi:hypothetical protein